MNPSAFADLTDAYLADLYAAEPVMATAKGVHAYDDTLPDPSRFAAEDDLRRCRAYLHALDKLSLANLSPDERIDYRLARADTQVRIVDFEQIRSRGRQPARYVDAVASGVHALLCRDFASTEPRAESALRRLHATPEYLLHARQQIANPSRLHVELAIEAAARTEQFLAADVTAFAHSRLTGSLSDCLVDAARDAARAVEDYRRFLLDEWLARSRDDFALGEELYEYILRVGLSLTESASELAEAARQAIDSALRNGRPVRQTAGAGTASLEAEIGWARRFVIERELASVPSDERLSVQAAGSLFDGSTYIPSGPFEPVRSGTLYAEEQDRTDPSAFAVRWAYPGRHLQCVVAGRHPSRYRRHFAESELLVGGWPLYSGELMCEAGFFTRERSSGHDSALLGACAALVDLGLHARRMMCDEAERILRETGGLSESRARKMVRTVAAHPTRSLAAFTGSQQIRALRERARRKLGGRFEIRAFHDTVLACGPIPPRLIEEAMFAVD